MDTKTLDRIKKLLRNSQEFATFWDHWRKKCAEPTCDKHRAGFNDDNRFSSFALTVSFDNAYGYYGNSSCGRLMGCDSDIAKEYFIKAINSHREQLFKTMAELMEADAKSLTDKARVEIAAMQQMVDEITNPPAAAA